MNGFPKVRKTTDDLTWWFIEAFASPEEAAVVKRMLDAVPEFFFNLAALGGGPVNMDWNFINQLRNHLRERAMPPPYQVATNSTKSEASKKAGKLVRRLTQAEEWLKKF